MLPRQPIPPCTVSWLCWQTTRDYKLYGSVSDHYALVRYNNVAFATNLDQVKLIAKYPYERRVFKIELYRVMEHLFVGHGKNVIPQDQIWTFPFRDEFADYDTAFVASYRAYLDDLKATWAASGLSDVIHVLYLADEPALHRNIFPSQAVLDAITEEAKEVFPQKKTSMAFSEDPQGDGIIRGPHYAPPPSLDVMWMAPYFWDTTLSCDPDAIRKYLYETNPNSALDWAFGFGKEVNLIGDAMLRNGLRLPDCYLQETYELARTDPRIQGLVWFIYDAEFSDGILSGAANDPALVSFIRDLNVW